MQFFISYKTKILIFFLCLKSFKRSCDKFEVFQSFHQSLIHSFIQSHIHSITHSFILFCFCVWGPKCLVWGGVMLPVWGIFVKQQPLIVFERIHH